MTQPALRTETLSDALMGFAAEVERFAVELEAHVEIFSRAAYELQSSFDAYAAWCEVHPRLRADERHKHIASLKMARTALQVIAETERSVIVSDEGSPRVRQAIRRHRAVLDRYRIAVDTVERFSVDVLRLLGVDAASPQSGGSGGSG